MRVLICLLLAGVACAQACALALGSSMTSVLAGSREIRTVVSPLAAVPI